VQRVCEGAQKRDEIREGKRTLKESARKEKQNYKWKQGYSISIEKRPTTFCNKTLDYN
jgi:hypothetical protein